jgi:hypothetical protein
MSHPYSRYLSAKKTVDDRSLNRHVLDRLRAELAGVNGRLRVLEVGAGLGTMVARLIDWGLLGHAHYVMLDVEKLSLEDAPGWLTQWAAQRGHTVSPERDGLVIRGDGGKLEVRVQIVCSEIAEFLRSTLPEERADLLIANAVLDMVDVPATLPGLFALLVKQGLYWFSINFDGETLFEPEHPDDASLMAAYHRGMDERVLYGTQAGDSRSGRHLFHHLRRAGASILASGSSDWVVHAEAGGQYHADEAHFVAFILHTIEEGLTARADVDQSALQAWLATRRSQLASGELLYLAHQLDYCGRAP